MTDPILKQPNCKAMGMRVLYCLVLLLSSVSAAAAAALPPDSVINACAKGENQDQIKIIPMPTNYGINQLDYTGKYETDYSIFQGIKFGYFRELNGEFPISIFYDNQFYLVSEANVISSHEIKKEKLENYNISLAGSDWYLVTTKNKQQYLCAVGLRHRLTDPAEIYILSLSTKPRQLFFTIVESDYKPK